MISRRAGFGAATLGLVSCLLYGENERRLGIRHDVRLQQHLDMGRNATTFAAGEDYPDLSSVGLVHSRLGYVGTGTLVSPYHVLTAAHVLRDRNSAPEPQPADWTFYLGSDYEAEASRHAVSEILLHPGWTARLPYNGGIGDGDLLGLDLALLKLKEPVTSVTPSRFHIGEAETLGSRLVMSGFGSLARGRRGVTDSENSQRLAGENVLDRVVQQAAAPLVPEVYRGGLLAVDFDEPYGATNSLGSHARPMDYLGTGDSSSTPLPFEASTALGDSGGPAFLRMDGAWKVVGTVSYGTKSSQYGDVTVYARLASQKTWLLPLLGRWPAARHSGSGEWVILSWFGHFTDFGNNWVFHEYFGWLYVPEDDPDAFWAWMPGLGWFWTSGKVYPFVYAAEHSAWLYLSTSASKPTARRFYDYEKKTWQTVFQ